MALTIHLKAAHDYTRMAWKNGGGETIEICKEPPQASLEDFTWRISMATVSADGPFSSFSGIDRTLAVLSGNGIELEIANRETCVLDRNSEPLAFPADVAVTARLLSGPILDLNLMTRRATHVHEMQKLMLPAAVSGEDGAHVFLILAAPCSIHCGGRTFDAVALDALRLEGSADHARIEGKGIAYRLVIRRTPQDHAAR